MPSSADGEKGATLREKSYLTGQPVVIPLWGNIAHHSDLMSRCVISRYYPLESVRESFALIRDPIERAVSSWDWMQLHQAGHMRRFASFYEYVTRGDGLVVDLFGVPQCAFVATK